VRGSGNAPFPEALFGGAIDDLHPRVLGSWSQSGGHGPATSDVAFGVYDSYSVQLATAGGPLATVYTQAQANGLQQNALGFFHDLATWESGTLVYTGVMAFRPDAGVYPFITFPGDYSRGAEALGTDGTDMVWTYEEGKGPNEGPYPVRSIMTSPFTSDPSKLAPRRLRSYPVSWSMIDPWTVGCGYAAHNLSPGAVLVVRLSDGASWTLTSSCKPPVQQMWCWGSVYALTCDEMFLAGGVGVQMNVDRVRMDALGPATPPD
jgi:hypothetical protein